jgi:hypothetical protein
LVSLLCQLLDPRLELLRRRLFRHRGLGLRRFGSPVVGTGRYVAFKVSHARLLRLFLAPQLGCARVIPLGQYVVQPLVDQIGDRLALVMGNVAEHVMDTAMEVDGGSEHRRQNRRWGHW